MTNRQILTLKFLAMAGGFALVATVLKPDTSPEAIERDRLKGKARILAACLLDNNVLLRSAQACPKVTADNEYPASCRKAVNWFQPETGLIPVALYRRCAQDFPAFQPLLDRVELEEVTE